MKQLSTHCKVWIDCDLAILELHHFRSIKAQIAVYFDRMKLAALYQPKEGYSMASPQFGDFIDRHERRSGARVHCLIRPFNFRLLLIQHPLLRYMFDGNLSSKESCRAFPRTARGALSRTPMPHQTNLLLRSSSRRRIGCADASPLLQSPFTRAIDLNRWSVF